MRNGIIPQHQVVESVQDRTTLSVALDSYKEYVQYHRSLRTFRTYRPILESFKKFCSKAYVDEVERQDFIDFATHLMKEGAKGEEHLQQAGRALTSDETAWPAQASQYL